MHIKFRLLPLIGLMLTLSACEPYGTGSETESSLSSQTKPLIMVSNNPLYYFATELAGNDIDVQFPIDTAGDPATWRPTAQHIAEFQRADLIVLNGAGYESWLTMVSLPTSRLLSTSEGFQHEWIPIEEGVTHSHGLEGEHNHRGFAITTWMDMLQASQQVNKLGEELMGRWPEQAADFELRLAALQQQLLTLDKRFQQQLARLGGESVIFSHPVYQYFQRRYQVNGRSLHWEPEQAPTDTQWQELQQMLAEQPVRIMIWEGEPIPETLRRLRDLGVYSVVVSPAANTVAEGDWLAIQLINIENLAELLDSLLETAKLQSN
ncbi:metal ABC transporter substrate-binding protein [Photobacterium sagamiensis]|uniref:metal ABC transporter substrate-binding protein n=1 Tax=Photobacterium sagamiensis TaxID=2910241 RepID=UPI003D14E515